MEAEMAEICSATTNESGALHATLQHRRGPTIRLATILSCRFLLVCRDLPFSGKPSKREPAGLAPKRACRPVTIPDMIWDTGGQTTSFFTPRHAQTAHHVLK